ncbi:hypothetical protein B0T18DRAFT_314603 [Schizothecium vesticola]|uniref:AAA+ ATPase domain-containing protein n=1 Tax=Schizothecium vesticola TaxID=314040 RepID=A0AA40KCI7_9PEZI|nr:hypothetical protein B0T18DRAFT_314603 [Schizothecium vesticola]
MASGDSSSPTDGAETADSTPGDATLSPRTSSQDREEGRRTEDANASDIPTGDGQKPAARGVGGITDEIRSKMPHGLERQAQNNPAAVEGEASRPKLMDDLEEYRRMEACLKQHRKEWERASGPGDWGIEDQRPRGYMMPPQQTWDPAFHLNWELKQERSFERPDLVQLSREVADGQKQGGADPYDDFDAIIDYGSRRDRLRKRFEWEMDRIYLAEEMGRRRKQKIEEAKAEPKAHSSGDKPLEGDGQPEDAGPPPPKFAEAQLNRVDWSAFSRLARVKEEDAYAVDILIGEPNVDDDLGTYQHWYGFSGQVRKRDIAPDLKAFASMLPGQPQLPERVRVHSEVLTRILCTILQLVLTPGTRALVFIRPFKALEYCKRALRDWCTALENKFKAAPETDKDVLTAAAGGEPPEAKGSEDEDDQEENDPDDVTKSPMALEHLKCLLSFVDEDISAKQAYLKSPDCRKVFFSDLWHLFRPGVEVTGSDGKQAYRVIHVTSAKHRVAAPWERWSNNSGKRKKARPFSITCLYIDFDGKNLGPVPKVFDFKRFDDERDVTSLEVYPLRFHPVKRADLGDAEWKELEALPADERYRQMLIRRGAKFLQVVGVKHMYYAGPTLEARDEVESQVVIDFETAFAVEGPARTPWKPELKTMIGNPEVEDGDRDEIDEICGATCCRGDNVHDDSYVDQKQREEYVNGLLPEAGAVNEQPSIAIIPRPLKELRTSSGTSLVSDDELVIMSYRVFGFVLRSRKWAKLDLSHLTDVHLPAAEGEKDQQGGTEKKSTTAFDRLVLEEWHRPMILALIAQHFRDKKSTVGQREEFDIVKGKGKGLILLLHGAPGVGKTSTAEGVADLFKKPLFQITCDLGTTAEEVEKALETNFALANRWDCILLLDEADVFLAERTKLDFKRNGLVAVFLRVMEYYAGILFLTTNRIGDFDEAFTSRIHVSLYYPDLNNEKTVKVFKLNMCMIRERFANKGRKIEIDEMGIGGFAAEHFTAHPQARWNGRQIRNACQTALALAEFEAQGNSHQDILRPDAVVKLGVEQFEVVRNAYLEFSRYMNKLYGSNSARRAKEAKVRAIWVDDNNNYVAEASAGGLDKRAFGAASKVQPQAPLQQWQQQPPPAQAQHYGYQNVAAPHPGYTDASRIPPAQADQFPPGGQTWDNPGARTASAHANANVNANAPYHGSWEGQNDALALRHPPPAGRQQYDPQQQQQQAYPLGFDRGIQEMYTASGPQATGQLPPGNLPPASGNAYAPGAAIAGQQWRGAPGPQ